MNKMQSHSTSSDELNKFLCEEYKKLIKIHELNNNKTFKNMTGCFACNSIDELDKDIIIHKNKRMCKICNHVEGGIFHVIIHNYKCIYSLQNKALKYHNKYLCETCKYYISVK